jgi:hypothetical protein
MNEIKILKNIESENLLRDFKDFYNRLPQNRKKETDQHYCILYNNEDEFFNLINDLSIIFVESRIIETLFDYSFELKLNEKRAEKLVESFFILHKKFLEYGLSLERLCLLAYLKSNDEININSYNLFNMNVFDSDLCTLLEDDQTVDKLLSLSLTNFADINMILNASQTIDTTSLKDVECKDFKIYKNKNQLKIITDNNFNLDRNILDKKYKIQIDRNFEDYQLVCALILSLKPSRIIFYSSIEESMITEINKAMNSLKDIYSGFKIYTAEENKPN